MAIEGSRQEHGAGRIRLGMVGGGQCLHRARASHRRRIDDPFELAAGALTSDPAPRASAAETQRAGPFLRLL